MSLGWINWINLAAVVYLILVNIIAAGKKLADSFCSKHTAINILEQIGRYGCMIFMIVPIGLSGWRLGFHKFGFNSVAEMLIWLCLTILLAIVYGILWLKKAKGGRGVLYGLAIVPVLLFLMNGILLRHTALIVTALIFGVFHVAIVRENA